MAIAPQGGDLKGSTLYRDVKPEDATSIHADPEMAPLYLRHEEIEILGIVSGVVRMAP